MFGELNVYDITKINLYIRYPKIISSMVDSNFPRNVELNKEPYLLNDFDLYYV